MVTIQKKYFICAISQHRLYRLVSSCTGMVCPSRKLAAARCANGSCDNGDRTCWRSRLGQLGMFHGGGHGDGGLDKLYEAKRMRSLSVGNQPGLMMMMMMMMRMMMMMMMAILSPHLFAAF